MTFSFLLFTSLGGWEYVQRCFIDIAPGSGGGW